MKQSNNRTIEPAHFEQLYPQETRLEEIKKIIEIIKSGRSCQLIGLPGVGKSNLLGLLPYNRSVRLAHLGENQKWFHFVYMDFSEVRKRALPDVIKFMLISTAYSLQERGLRQEYETVQKFILEAKDFDDELMIFQSLKKAIDYLSIEKELTVVFLFDRFDQYIPSLTEEFFSNLKILRNRAKYRFACVFALNRELTEMIEPQVLSEFYEFVAGNAVFLRLHDKEGLHFRFSYLEKVTGKKADEKVKNELISLTGGHGKLSRISYETILSELGKIRNLSEFLSSKKAINGALWELWNFLTPQEKRDLKLGEENAFLEKVGLTTGEKINIPLFGDFIESLLLESEEKLNYDSEKNEIIKGTENLTEKLSPSEFRLLRFLLQNTGRVCEKNEIINDVWKDSQTQEGVTDQALDQIIYRLRKKIEDDPNNPQFIQTIKGRGYKTP